MSYAEFLDSKRLVVPSAGIEVSPDALPHALRDFQRAMTAWALRKGRAALFATTGMGKTLMQLAWAQHAAERVLILAPLAVAQQTVREGERWGIPVTYARSQAHAAERGITITNYEMLPHFDPAAFGAVVLDESGILKSYDGKTRSALIAAFADTPRRLCCTATPAPNDIQEIANHAEFLGVLSRVEMLAAFFVHDEKGWRLKGHARQPFYRWLASWAMAMTKPSDLGYDDDGYDLPPLSIRPEIVASSYVPDGRLFAAGLSGVGERAEVRRGTLAARVERATALIAAEPGEPWIAWCGLNDEQQALEAAFGDECASIYGALSPDEKVRRLGLFLSGERRILLSKPTVCGFGLNLQHCARMVFVGLSDSYEQYFQNIRRCWRYAQRREVHAHIVLSDLEEPIYHNVLRKEQEATALMAELVGQAAAYEREELAAVGARVEYQATQPIRLPAWLGRMA